MKMIGVLSYLFLSIAGYAQLSLASTWSHGERVYGTALKGTNAFVSTTSGVSVLDLTDPSSPFEMARVNGYGGSSPQLLIDGNILFTVSDQTNPAILSVINIFNPAFPLGITELQLGSGWNRVRNFLEGNYMYIPLDSLWVINVGNPANPFIVTVSPENYRGIVFYNQVAFAVKFGSPIYICDYSSPPAITVIDSLLGGYNFVWKDPLRPRIYCQNGSGPSQHDAFDIGGPNFLSPVFQLVSSDYFLAENQNVAAALYNSTPSAQVVKLYELSPTSLTLIDSYSSGIQTARNLSLSDSVILVSNSLPAGGSSNRLEVYTYSGVPVQMNGGQQANPEEITIFPVPSDGFFEIKSSTPDLKIFELNLYDFEGRKVKTWENAQFEKKIRMEEVPSGSYFIQLVTDKGGFYSLILVQRSDP